MRKALSYAYVFAPILGICSLVLVSLDAPVPVLLFLPIVGGGLMGLVYARTIMRAGPIAEMPGDFATDGVDYVFNERITSNAPIELPGVFQALRVAVSASEFIVRWDGDIAGRWAGSIPTTTFGAAASGLGFREALGRISKAEPRRLPLLQFLWETLRPYQGLGMTGEWKFRMRGVRTGVAIQTERGLRAWVATRRPDELVRAIRAGSNPIRTDSEAP